MWPTDRNVCGTKASTHHMLHVCSPTAPASIHIAPSMTLILLTSHLPLGHLHSQGVNVGLSIDPALEGSMSLAM